LIVVDKCRVLCESIRSEYGEEIVAIRHDVDNIYGIYRPYRFPKMVKAINYGFLALLSLSPRLRYIVPYYMEHMPILLDIEERYGARATYFFRPVTLPKRSLLRELKSRGHELAYHSDRNDSYETWLHDLRYVEKALGEKVYGVAKHGYSIVRSGGYQSIETIIDYASRAGLKYVGAGVRSGLSPEGRGPPFKTSNVWVFRHHITLKFTPFPKLKQYLDRCVPMILIHPEDIFIPGENEKLEYILSKRKGVTLIDIISTIEKLESELGF
jgi:peptidoglycan/xylan/chitin deacetylase (PgdA/CDA1 family)